MPSLSTFQATKATQLLHADSLAEAEVESGSSMPLTSGNIVTSAAGGQSIPLADLKSQASAFPVGSSMLPLLFTTSVVMTPSSVTTPLFSSSTPTSILDSPMGDVPVSGKEMPTTSARGESTSAKDTTVSDTRGVQWSWWLRKGRLESQLHAVGVREIRFVLEKKKAEDDLKRVTANLAEERIIWARDIAEKYRILSRAKAVQEELERKAVNEPRKVRSELSAEVEKFRVDTDFVYQVQERYQDLTIELEASNAKAQAKQVELEECKEKLRELQQICDALVSEKNQLMQASSAQQAHLKEMENALDQSHAKVDSLTSRLAGLQGDRNWLISQGHHDGIHEGYVSCHQTGKVTPDFQDKGGKLSEDMEDALEAVYNDPLPAYADWLTKWQKMAWIRYAICSSWRMNPEKNERCLFDICTVP
ncbi:hypothetical protein Hanom_Chr04g00338481 [Helianthus anomalus]